jgi:CHAT domain-containing protein
MHNPTAYLTYLITPVLLGSALLAGPSAPLLDALRAAANPEARLAILRAHSREEIVAAFAESEQQATTSFAAGDCKSAAAEYEIAADLAKPGGSAGKLPLIFRRIGMCRARLGAYDVALEAYYKGVAESEKLQDREMLGENLHGVVYTLRALGRYADALPVAEREYALEEHCNEKEHVVRALLSLAPTLSKVGRTRDSAARYEQALELSRKGNFAYGIDAALSGLAMTYSVLGDTEAGLRVMTEQLSRQSTPDAITMNQYSVLLMRAHRDREAEQALHTTIQLAKDPGQAGVRVSAQVDLAQLHSRQGQLARARTDLDGALELARAHQNPHLAGAVQIELSRLALAEGRIEEALERANDAVALEKRSVSFELINDALSAQGQALEASGRNREAESSYFEAIEMVEAMRAGLPGYAPGLEAAHRKLLPSYQFAVRFLIRRGRVAEALAVSERAKSRILNDFLAEGEPLADAALSAEERATEGRLRSAVMVARKASLDGQDTAALERAQQEWHAFERDLYLRHPELVLQRADFEPVRVDQLRDFVSGGKAILSYFELPDEMAVFIVRETGVWVEKLPFDDVLTGEIRNFRASLAARDMVYRKPARSLFEKLVAPAMPHLTGTTEWIIAPDGALWQLPFQALMNADGRHLLETRVLSYAPSLTVLWHQRRNQRERSAADGPLLAIGRAQEIEGVAQLYRREDSMILTGRDASVARFEKSAERAGVIHVAAHGELDGRHPLESFLRLVPGTNDDGALTARQLMRMRLRARLVVLSACETALGKAGSGEGLMGLGWALGAAGSPVSIVSQWKVDAAATRDLMLSLHRGLRGSEPLSEAAALRRAALATMKQPMRRHPFYWAGFVVLGDGSGRRNSVSRN